jgi:hypothetical protein
MTLKEYLEGDFGGDWGDDSGVILGHDFLPLKDDPQNHIFSPFSTIFINVNFLNCHGETTEGSEAILQLVEG